MANIKQQLSDFGAKVGGVATAASFPGMAAGQALADNAGLRAAGSALKPLADIAVHHPYGSGMVGAAITGLVGAGMAVAHHRGQVVGRRSHAIEAAHNARR